MLTKEMNEKLTRVGPGTPTDVSRRGRALRRKTNSPDRRDAPLLA